MLYEERRLLYNKRGKLSNSLREFKIEDDAGRKAVCEEIDGLSAQLRRINDSIDEIERPEVTNKAKKATEANQPTVVPLDLAADPVVLLRAVQNLRTRVSKWKKQLAQDLPESKRIELQVLIENATEQIKRVNS